MHLDLNTSQVQAVTCSLGPTIVIAGPGSGKTHVIINRINYMIHQLECLGQHILVVTFSKLAAKEMRERFLEQSQIKSVHFGTLHSIFYRILKAAYPAQYAVSNLLSDYDKKSILQNFYLKLEADEYEDFIDEFIKHLSLMKNQLINPKYYYPDGISKEVFYELVKQYENYKALNNRFDFDDMLVDCYHLLCNDKAVLQAVQNRYRYILIDEFQDINLVQFEIIKMLTGDKKSIFVVGDDDQSIYKFRGAKPEFLLDFKKHFASAKEFYLDVNYRSTQSILDYSMALIASNKNRYLKNLTTPNPKGSAPQLIYCKDSKEQADRILEEIVRLKHRGERLSNMAVIFRTHLEARPIVELLITSHIPFYLRDGMISLYEQWITKDIIGYLYLAQNINLTDFAANLLNKPKRYISKTVIDKVRHQQGSFFMNLLSEEQLSEWQKNYIQQLLFDLQKLKELPLCTAIAYIRQNIGYDNYVADYAAYRKIPSDSLFEMMDELEESSKNFENVSAWEAFLKEISQRIKDQTPDEFLKEAVTLTTMHGSKGLEFNHVFIINVVEGSIPHHKCNNDMDLEEERRLFYVAMTRAKSNLRFYIPAERYAKPVKCSLFIEELIHKYLALHIQKNQWISHSKLGRGRILDILEDNILKIEFIDNNIRKIDGNYCISNGIIQWEE